MCEGYLSAITFFIIIEFSEASSVTLLENLSSILCNFVRRDGTKMYQSFWISEQRFKVWYLRRSQGTFLLHIHPYTLCLSCQIWYNIFTVISESCLIHTTAWQDGLLFDPQMPHMNNEADSRRFLNRFQNNSKW